LLGRQFLLKLLEAFLPEDLHGEDVAVRF
jgi:hypothetical protein